MSAPDASLTPYALVFGGERFEREVFPEIEAEADARGVNTASPESFLMLARVGAALRELPAAGAQDAETALLAFGALLFHAYHFRRFGRRAFVLEQSGLDVVVGSDPIPSDWVPSPPHPAGYVKLPRQRLWSRVQENAPAEPVDGFFWTMIGADGRATPPHERLDALLALGLRAERPGLSVIPVGIALGAASPDWLHGPARDHGLDFANVLPGGDLRNLHAVVNAAEALELVARVFWLMTSPQHARAVRALEDRDG